MLTYCRCASMRDMRKFDGTLIREARIAKGLRPEHLAILVSRSNSTILAYERGRVIPSADALAQLSDALDVPIDDMFR